MLITDVEVQCMITATQEIGKQKHIVIKSMLYMKWLLYESRLWQDSCVYTKHEATTEDKTNGKESTSK